MANPTTVVTTAGIQAAINAGNAGAQIQITSFEVSSSIVVPSFGMTSLPNIVYTGTSSEITYSAQADINTMVFTITMGSNIGPFTIGSLGLILSDGTLFTVTALPTTVAKVATTSSGGVTTPGNNLSYAIAVEISNIANLVNVTNIVANYASLPTVATQNNLPAIGSNFYNAYIVEQYYSESGVAETGAIAVALATAWQVICNTGRILAINTMPGPSGTFVPDTRAGAVVVIMCGGGGGGGGTIAPPTNGSSCAEGGSSGSLIIAYMASNFANVSYTVGSGGAFGGIGSSGTNGGTSTFGTAGSELFAPGGVGGAAGTGIASGTFYTGSYNTFAQTAYATGSGSTPSAGSVVLLANSGSVGTPSVSLNSGLSVGIRGGSGGDGLGGGGGAGGSHSANGFPGNSPGAGGGGACSTYASSPTGNIGGSGANGTIIIISLAE